MHSAAPGRPCLGDERGRRAAAALAHEAHVVKEALAAVCRSSPLRWAIARTLAGVAAGRIHAREPDAFTAAVERVLLTGARSNGREAIAPLELSAVARRVLAVYERVLAARGAGAYERGAA